MVESSIRDLITGVVLAGGKSRRMGIDKATLRVGSSYLIEFPLKVFSKLFDDILIITNSALLNTLKSIFNHDKIRILEDIHPNHGALGGIYTALCHSRTPYIFVSACDMPFLNKDFIKYMTQIGDKYDVIIPKSPHGFETLHAIYKKTIIKIVESSLLKDQNKIIDFFPNINVYAIPPDKLKGFDQEGKMFSNINTQDEFKKAFS